MAESTSPLENVVIVFDGGSRGNPGPGYGSFRIEYPDGTIHRERIDFAEILTNNQAEYRTLIAALETLLTQLDQAAIPPESVSVSLHTDSELLAQQLRGAYKVRNPTLRTLHEQVRTLLSRFGRWEIHWHPRDVIYAHFGH